MDEPCPECGAKVDVYTEQALLPDSPLTRTRHCPRCGFHEVKEVTPT